MSGDFVRAMNHAGKKTQVAGYQKTTNLEN